jgi:hypothetical protein
MLFKATFAALMLVSSVVAVAIPEPAPEPIEIVVDGQGFVEFENVQCQPGNSEEDFHGLKPICTNLNTTAEKGCIRCRGIRMVKREKDADDTQMSKDSMLLESCLRLT